MDALSRVSPAALVDTLDLVGAQTARFFETTDPHAPSLGVSWAGADPSPMWLDSARELTEYWTHRQQIRHAAGQDTDHGPRPLSVVLDTFLRALPHALRGVDALPGTRVRIQVEGPAGGTWTATATDDGWSLAEPDTGRPATTVHLDPETTWRLCTRGIEPRTDEAPAEDLPKYQAAREAALSVAVPFADYWAAHPEFHSDRS